MSNGSSVGPRFKGKAKGTVTYSGTNTVESDKNVDVGGLFDGDVEVGGNVNFNETNQLNTRTQQNTDQNKEAQSSEASPSKVEGFKLEESETSHIGSTVYNQCEDRPRIHTGIGAVASVKNIKGDVKNKCHVYGDFSGQSRDIGDVTISENIEGKVTFEQDVNVTMNQRAIYNNETHTLWEGTSATLGESLGSGRNFLSNLIGYNQFISNVIQNAIGDLDIITNVDTSTYRNQSKELGFSINGHMTIFNQEFKDSLYYRSGSANDVESLTTTFRKFGIEPSIKLDFKRKDIVNEIKALSTTDFSTCKLFLCVYMSHGHENGYVSASDKEFNLRKTIIDPIMENSTLNGIPKIFITVACRGANNYEEHDNEEYDGCITSTANGIDYSNCIISYSTYEGHVSKRTRTGTYFIQSLCDKINNDDGNMKIHSLFAKVNGELAEMGKQVPVFETTMRDICLRDLASTH